MKFGLQIIAIALLASWANTTCAQNAPEAGTFYIVRHADRDGSNDALTSEGVERANHLRELMKTLQIDAIFSTDTVRTKSTAAPTATALGLEVQIYGDLTPEWFEQIKTEHTGKAVLIVGHSNTSGLIAKGLGGQGDFEIEEDEYQSLFVVTTGVGGAASVRLRYGKRQEIDEVEENE